MTSRAQLELTAVDKTKAAFDSVNRNLQGVGDRVTTMLPMLGRLGPALAAGIGPATIGAAVAGIVAMTKAQADAVDRYNDLKDATNASIENISALDDLARRHGHSWESVGTALIKFNDVLKEGDKAGVFKAIGLDVERLKELDPAEAMRQTAVALSQFADDGNKARAVQELFGRSIREVAPLLKDLAEQGELVAKVTTEQAEEAEKFNKQLFAMQANLNDVARAGAMPMISAFNSLADAFRESRREGDNLLEVVAKFSPNGLLFRLMGFGGPRTNGFTDARTGIENINKSLAGDTSLTESERRAMEAERARLEAQMAGYLNSTAGAGRGTGGYGRFALPGIELPSAAGGGGKTRAVREQEDKTWLERRKEWLRKYDEQEKERQDIEERAARNLAGWMERWAAEGDAMSRRLDAAERAAARQANLNAELDALSGRTGDDRKRALTEQLEERLNAGEKFTPEELEKLVNGIAGISKATAEATSNANDFGGAFSSALDDVLFRAKDVGDVVKGLAMNVASIGLQQAITKPLGDSFGKFLSGLIPSFDGGGYTGNRARAGGMDGKGGFLAMLHPDEDVIDRTKGGRAARGGDNIRVIVNASDNASRGDLARAVQFGMRQAQAQQRRREVYS